MSRNLPVSGAKQIAATLTALGKRIESQAIRSGLVAAANPPMEEARLRAGTWSAQVAAAITKGSSRKNQDGTYSIRIYVDERKPDGFLGYFAEYGVAPHLIARTGARQGRVAIRKAAEGKGKVNTGVLKIGDRFVSGIVRHPGHAAHPFMRVSLDMTAEQAIAAFRDKIVGVVERKTGFNLAAAEDEAA
ncbi:hypothetical protein [Novosphingobium sp. AP12]|uniref:hypothetical protein n=1 Tax=Novosphingobium sp. AP12 TaxID=1144305 RepID=UPI000271DDFF|nr:hypothetical protein [Novosphingobium sp. AP12]EJL21897.1 Bacteriophage hypothetical protein (DUF646) [Novosphingobium sp. AP12]